MASRDTSQKEPTAELFCNVKEAKARGAVTDDGFVVFRGSTALKGTTDSMAPGWIAFKVQLESSRKLVDKGGTLLEFSEDVLFSSPSAAAAIVYGNNANGRVLWKTRDGRTLKEIEETQASTEK